MCGRPFSKMTLPTNNVKELRGATKPRSPLREGEDKVHTPTQYRLQDLCKTFRPFSLPHLKLRLRQLPGRNSFPVAAGTQDSREEGGTEIPLLRRRNEAGRRRGKHAPLTRWFRELPSGRKRMSQRRQVVQVTYLQVCSEMKLLFEEVPGPGLVRVDQTKASCASGKN